MLYYVHTLIMFKHVNFGESIFEYIRQKSKKHAHLKISPMDEVFTRLFSIFFYPGINSYLCLFDRDDFTPA